MHCQQLNTREAFCGAHEKKVAADKLITFSRSRSLETLMRERRCPTERCPRVTARYQLANIGTKAMQEIVPSPRPFLPISSSLQNIHNSIILPDGRDQPRTMRIFKPPKNRHFYL